MPRRALICLAFALLACDDDAPAPLTTCPATQPEDGLACTEDFYCEYDPITCCGETLHETYCRCNDGLVRCGMTLDLCFGPDQPECPQR